MPNRILREAIITSRAVSALSDSGQIFYRCLMSVVDDYGRFESDLDLLRARCFPRQLDRWPLSRVSASLAECGEARSSDGVPLISVYSDGVSDKMYCQINNFGQRIRSDKKGETTPSKYPAPPIVSEAPRSAASSGDLPPESKALALAESKAHAQTEPPVRAVLPAIKSALKPARAADLNGQTSSLFNEFWERYPRKQHKDAACHEWVSVVDVDSEPLVFACLSRYLASDEVSRGAVANPEKWLMEQYRDGWAGTWPGIAPRAQESRETPTQAAIRKAKETQNGTR